MGFCHGSCTRGRVADPDQRGLEVPMETGPVFFLFTTGVGTNDFQSHLITLSSQNRDVTKLVRSSER